MQTYFPETRVLAFDPRLFIDDITTPLSVTMQPATVLKWYGMVHIPVFEDRHKSGELTLEEVRKIWTYPSLVTIKYDRDGYICDAKFADKTYLKILK